jgi:hypothetical protein
MYRTNYRWLLLGIIVLGVIALILANSVEQGRRQAQANATSTARMQAAERQVEQLEQALIGRWRRVNGVTADPYDYGDDSTIYDFGLDGVLTFSVWSPTNGWISCNGTWEIIGPPVTAPQLKLRIHEQANCSLGGATITFDDNQEPPRRLNMECAGGSRATHCGPLVREE